MQCRCCHPEPDTQTCVPASPVHAVWGRMQQRFIPCGICGLLRPARLSLHACPLRRATSDAGSSHAACPRPQARHTAAKQ
eukprot:363864-Chlamydomonas_euryale.AAC.22